jgi:hypothetical protein
LMDSYGWRNLVFIQAAIILNCAVCGMLMRPLKPVRKKKVRVVQSLVFIVMFCRSLFVQLSLFLLAIALFVLLRFTAFDYSWKERKHTPDNSKQFMQIITLYSIEHIFITDVAESFIVFCLAQGCVSTNGIWFYSFFDLRLLITPLVSSNSSYLACLSFDYEHTWWRLF